MKRFILRYTVYSFGGIFRDEKLPHVDRTASQSDTILLSRTHDIDVPASNSRTQKMALQAHTLSACSSFRHPCLSFDPLHVVLTGNKLIAWQQRLWSCV